MVSVPHHVRDDLIILLGRCPQIKGDKDTQANIIFGVAPSIAQLKIQSPSTDCFDRVPAARRLKNPNKTSQSRHDFESCSATKIKLQLYPASKIKQIVSHMRRNTLFYETDNTATALLKQEKQCYCYGDKQRTVPGKVEYATVRQLRRHHDREVQTLIAYFTNEEIAQRLCCLRHNKVTIHLNENNVDSESETGEEVMDVNERLMNSTKLVCNDDEDDSDSGDDIFDGSPTRAETEKTTEEDDDPLHRFDSTNPEHHANIASFFHAHQNTILTVEDFGLSNIKESLKMALMPEMNLDIFKYIDTLQEYIHDMIRAQGTHALQYLRNMVLALGGWWPRGCKRKAVYVDIIVELEVNRLKYTLEHPIPGVLRHNSTVMTRPLPSDLIEIVSLRHHPTCIRKLYHHHDMCRSVPPPRFLVHVAMHYLVKPMWLFCEWFHFHGVNMVVQEELKLTQLHGAFRTHAARLAFKWAPYFTRTLTPYFQLFYETAFAEYNRVFGDVRKGAKYGISKRREVFVIRIDLCRDNLLFY